MVAKEDACREYQASLEHLAVTSELHISMLTSLAREHLPFARDIGAIIEARISKAPSSEKPLLLYLVDSIVTKVGGEYLAVFAKNLPNTFQCVYEKVDENMREHLFNLRTTWENVFPPKQLHALDVQVNNLGPAWPIKPLLPTADSSIHVNPLKRGASSLQAISPQLAASTAHPVPVQVPVVSNASVLRRQLIWQQLPAMHKEPLQQQKEIEQLQTKAQMAPPPVCTPAPSSSPPQPDAELSNRDPHLKCFGSPPAPQPIEQPPEKKKTEREEAKHLSELQKSKGNRVNSLVSKHKRALVWKHKYFWSRSWLPIVLPKTKYRRPHKNRMKSRFHLLSVPHNPRKPRRMHGKELQHSSHPQHGKPNWSKGPTGEMHLVSKDSLRRAISEISQDDFLNAAEEGNMKEQSQRHVASFYWGEREWNLPQTVCQYYDEREVQKNNYNIPRRLPHPQGHCEGGMPVHFDESSQYNIPHQQGPCRHDHGGLPMYNMPERFNGPGWYAPSTLHGPMGGQGVIQGPPDPFNNNIAPKPGNTPMDFLPQQCWMRFDCPLSQMGSMRFEAPRPVQMGPGQPGPTFYMPNMPPHYNCLSSQQGPPRYTPPQNMQPLGPPIYNNLYAPQQNFNMVGHSLPGPLNLNPQLPVGSLAFPAQQTTVPFSQLATGPFYSCAAPAGGMQQQPINMMLNLNQAFLPQNPVPVTQPASQLVPPESHLVQVNINHLLSKLISTGIIPAITPARLDENTAVGPAVEREERGEVDLTSFCKEDLKQRYGSVVNELHTGSQCSSCGMRFPADQSNVYANHLDWHYRNNRSKKESRDPPHRHWYCSLVDWIMSGDTADLEEQMRQKVEREKELQSVQATTRVGREECQICHEVFEMYWAETEEEWHLNNAVMVDSKLYHAICYEDHKNVNT